MRIKAVSYIYCFENLKTKRKYIGSTNDVERRLQEHLEELRKNIHFNRRLQADYNINHPFDFYVLEETSVSQRWEREDFYIRSNIANCYNKMDAKGILLFKPIKAALSERYYDKRAHYMRGCAKIAEDYENYKEYLIKKQRAKK